MEAGSTIWLSIPSVCRMRWIQNPSSPASWMTMMGKTCPVRARAFSLSWDKRAKRAAMSPLGTACFDIFSPPPGAREVMTQVERLSSRDTKIALRSVRTAACLSGRGQRACMVAPEWVVQHPTLPESKMLPVAPMGSFYRRIRIDAGDRAMLAPARDHPGLAPGAALLPAQPSRVQGAPDRIGADLGQPVRSLVQGSLQQA